MRLPRGYFQNLRDGNKNSPQADSDRCVRDKIGDLLGRSCFEHKHDRETWSVLIFSERERFKLALLRMQN